MVHPSRDRISVDMRGMKSALLERARARGTSPSEWVRTVLAVSLGREIHSACATPSESRGKGGRTRLTLRMHEADAQATLQAARAAGLSPGTYVAGLVAQAPVLVRHDGPAAHAAALTSSCAELATLSRNLHHLTNLLRQGSSRAAQEYSETLDNLAADVRAHLVVASAVVAELSPLLRTIKQRNDSPTV